MARQCDGCRERPATLLYQGRKERYLRWRTANGDVYETRKYPDLYLCEDCAAVRANIPGTVSPFPLRLPDGG